MRRIHVLVVLSVFAGVFAPCRPSAAADVPDEAVRTAMRRATSFMMKDVAYNSGFVWRYSEDLAKRWGEIPARDTQIWVQGATNGVGELLLDVYEATGDEWYLERARDVADAILWGQYPEGGWHYLIDFDMAGIQRWYDEVASKCWGWEEYYHYYGNCTFDDSATSSSIRLLMHIFRVTRDPKYRAPLMKALEFVLEAQFPNGAWPQRYPLKYDFCFDGKADYTSFYTFNDEVIFNNIIDLRNAWELFGDERFNEAARRGMDFYLISQTGHPQGGWSEQYSHDMQPAQARGYEPAGLYVGTTLRCIRDLEFFYTMTGDTRYLNPIERAIDWLENSAISTDPADGYTHAYIYETGTNRPIYTHRYGTSIENGGYFTDYDLGDPVCHYPQVTTVNVGKVRDEYLRFSALSPDEARAGYEREKNEAHRAVQPDGAELRALLDSLDGRGAWVTDIRIPNYANPCANGRKGTMIRGIDTRVFISNMYSLLAALDGR